VLFRSGQQFRQVLLANQNHDGNGGVSIVFSTNLDAGNGLWSTSLCDDKITSIKAQVVGDFLGDDRAEVKLELEGAAFIRRCDQDEIVPWDLDGTTPRPAVLQAGVNKFPDIDNAELFGQSVARATWRITIPGPNAAPNNADVDLSKVEDIILRVKHEARPRLSSTPKVSVQTSCLSTIGK
jgi:hypothetical protein